MMDDTGNVSSASVYKHAAENLMPCLDCGVEPGEVHAPDCEVVRLIEGGSDQRWSGGEW